MSLAQIEYFIAVAEEEHLTRAAARLHISQPPLTRQIKSLEEELGEPLFERRPQGMRLLPAGELFLEEAREISQRIRSLPARIRDHAQRVHRYPQPPPRLDCSPSRS